MKQILRHTYSFFAALLLATSVAQAQQTVVNLHKGNIAVSYPASCVEQMQLATAGGATTLTLDGQAVDVATIDSLLVLPSATFEERSACVTFGHGEARLTVSHDIAAEVKATFDGAHAEISLPARTRLTLGGESADGSLWLHAADSIGLVLADGFSLSCGEGTAIAIDGASHTTLLLSGSSTVSTGGSAALSATGSLTVAGDGSLRILLGQAGSATGVEVSRDFTYACTGQLRVEGSGDAQKGLTAGGFFRQADGSIEVALSGSAATDILVDAPYSYSLDGGTLAATVSSVWQAAGKAFYRDDILASIYTLGNYQFEVDTYTCPERPGVYRVHKAYTSGAFAEALVADHKAINVEEVNAYYLSPEDETDFFIEASDPDHVYVYGNADSKGYYDLGVHLNPADGQVMATSFIQSYLSSGYTVEELIAVVPDCFGTLRDGIVTMPANSMIALLSKQGGMYYANANAKLRFALPGVVPADYEAAFQFDGVTSEDGQDIIHATVQLGADVAKARVAVAPAENWRSEEEFAEAVVAGSDRFATVEITKSGEVTFAGGDKSGLYLAAVVTYDAKGNAQVRLTDSFRYTSSADAARWQPVNDGQFTFGVNTFLGTQPVTGGRRTIETTLYSDPDNPGRYKIAIPTYSDAGELRFTLGEDLGDGKVSIEVDPTSPLGYSDPNRGGDYLIMEAGYYTENMAAYHSYYDTVSGEYHFFLAYGTKLYYFGLEEDVYVPAEPAAVVRRRATPASLAPLSR